MKTRTRTLLTLFALFLALGSFAAEEDKTLSPYFLVKSNNRKVDQLPLKHTSADVHVAGTIADVTVTQVYKNEGKRPIEAIYVFPASTRAAVYDMKMVVGERVIQAKIKERQQARQEYEAAKAAGKRTSLLEQDRPNVFQMNVANILPGDEVKVVMRYTENLVPNGGIYQFVYPTVVGPRYSETPAEGAADTEDFVSTPYLQAGDAPTYIFGLTVNINAGMPIQDITCQSHQISAIYHTLSNATVLLAPSEAQGGNRDYILEYSLAGGEISSGLLLYEHGDENFFALTVQPPKRVTSEQIPPREYVFIVDVSGSMGGFPLDVSKKLLRDLITGLKPTDKFNVVLFAGTTAVLGQESLLASQENVEKAVYLIDRQRGGGGTRLMGGLQKAIDLPRDPGLSRSVVVVTDGYISVEQECFDLIRSKLNKCNVFSFGIGSGVNRHLIEGLAHVGMGEPLIITSTEGAHEKAEEFRQYINRPVLTNIEARFDGFEAYDVEPLSIPDVLAERPIVIHGKYRGKAAGSINITGYAGNKPYSSSYAVAQASPNPRNAALRYLWAREKIRTLDDYNNLYETPERKKEVTDLGLKYNLLTAYTSFIAVEEHIANKKGKLQAVKQALPLPQGVGNGAVGFELEIAGVSEAIDASTPRSYISFSDLQSSLSKGQERSFANMLRAKLMQLHATPTEELAIAAGQVQLQLTLNSSGHVIAVKVVSNALSEASMQSLEAAILGWHFSSLRLRNNSMVEFKLSL